MCVIPNKENVFFTNVKFNIHFAIHIPPFRIEALIHLEAWGVDC